MAFGVLKLTALFNGVASLSSLCVTNVRRHSLMVLGDLSSFRHIDAIVQPSCRSCSATARSHFLLLLDDRHAFRTLMSSVESSFAQRLLRGFLSLFNRLVESHCPYRFEN